MYRNVPKVKEFVWHDAGEIGTAKGKLTPNRIVWDAPLEVVRSNSAHRHAPRASRIDKNPRGVSAEGNRLGLRSKGYARCDDRKANAHPTREP